jgi:hypothetical protein
MIDNILAGISVGLGFLLVIIGGVWYSTLRPVFHALALNQNLTLGLAAIVSPIIFAIFLTSACFYLVTKTGEKQ